MLKLSPECQPLVVSDEARQQHDLLLRNGNKDEIVVSSRLRMQDYNPNLSRFARDQYRLRTPRQDEAFWDKYYRVRTDPFIRGAAVGYAALWLTDKPTVESLDIADHGLASGSLVRPQYSREAMWVKYIERDSALRRSVDSAALHFRANEESHQTMLKAAGMVSFVLNQILMQKN